MLLKKTWVYRRSAHPGATTQVEADWAMPATGDGDVGVEFRFDMGSKDQHERLALFLHNSDFGPVAKLMASADREKAIQAFSRALIETKP